MLDLWRHKATSGEKNFIEQIKPLVFLEAFLTIEVMEEPQFNLEEKSMPAS